MTTAATIRKSDLQVYRFARKFLNQIEAPGLSKVVIESYLVAPAAVRPKTLNGLYQKLLMSAQNANMKAKVIGASIGGVENLKPVLMGFSPKRVITRYGPDAGRLLKDITKGLKPRGQIRKAPRSIWPQYCRTVLSAANFLARFKSASDFYAWVDFFDGDIRARPALPLIISKEIEGMGFALACDFLKELGYANFGKPDVHIRDIFNAAGLCDSRTGDYELLKTLCRVAQNAGVSPYTADKVFWLIGSGFFYHHRDQVGRDGRIPRPKKEFIRLLKGRMHRR